MINYLLDKIDERRKAKALKSFPWRYKDRHGKMWINATYRCSWNKLRKYC